MAQSHAKRWIIQMKNYEGKWVRSNSYPQPYFSKEEAVAALTVAQSAGTGVEYKLRSK